MELDYKTIGHRIQSRRRMKGVTQEKIAEDLDFSVGFISQAERGVTKLSLDSLYSITQYLDCRVADIIDDAEEEILPYYFDEFETMYRKLSSADQKLFYSMLKEYVRNREETSP